jgi:hypothetical protein
MPIFCSALSVTIKQASKFLDRPGRRWAFGELCHGMSVALTLVKPGGFMNRLRIIGLLVMFTLPL